MQSVLCERWWFLKYLFLLVSVWKYFLILNIFTTPLRRDCKVVQKASYNSKIIPRPPMILRIIPKSTYRLSRFYCGFSRRKLYCKMSTGKKLVQWQGKEVLKGFQQAFSKLKNSFQIYQRIHRKYCFNFLDIQHIHLEILSL